MVCSAKHIDGSSPAVCVYTVEQLAGTADACLFKTIASNPNHSLYQILPPLKPNQYSLCNQQSAMMKTDAGTCSSLSVSLLTTSSTLSNHFLLYSPMDLRFQLYQQSNQTSHSDQPKIYPTVF